MYIRIKKWEELMNPITNQDLPVNRTPSSNSLQEITTEQPNTEQVNLFEDQLSLSTFLKLSVTLVVALDQIHKKGKVYESLSMQSLIMGSDKQTIEILDPSDPNFPPEHPFTYQSPEQINQINKGIDYRTDFYSLGIILYEWLSGKPPFEERDPLALRYQHLAKTPVPLHSQPQDVPIPLSNIIMKLLQKDVDERYQSCKGLQKDLEHCLSMLEQTGHIQNFTLGTHDLSQQLRFPRRFYGRDTEIEQLTNAIPAKEDPMQSIFVSGYAGCGKTALIQSIQKNVLIKKGVFISGKFDQKTNNQAYQALTQAFEPLITRILEDDLSVKTAWKTQLNKAIEPNGQLLVTLIPNIEKLIGKQPPLLEIGIMESQNRFQYTIESFLNTLLSKQSPIILFLDDLQWADPATLTLLNALSSFNCKGFLLIGSYRDNEVSSDHPFFKIIQNIKTKQQVKTINLKPLTIDDLNQWLADTLQTSRTLTRPLTTVVYNKTLGNPFFTRTFLQFVSDKEFLKPTQFGWQWNLDDIIKEKIASNIVDFLIQKIHGLSKSDQRRLKHFSCLGHSFSIETLKLTLNVHEDFLNNSLSSLIDTGLVYKQHNHIHFTHDRVQEACYALLSDEEKETTHLSIAKHLTIKLSTNKPDRFLYFVIEQFQLGVSHLIDQKDRLELAALTLKAAQNAKSETAFETALTYIKFGYSLLPSLSWTTHYSLRFDIGKLLAELFFICKQTDSAASECNSLINNAKTTFEKASIYYMQLIQYTVIGKLEIAINKGLVGVDLLGSKISEKPSSLNVLKELMFNRTLLLKRDISKLIDYPLITDPKKILLCHFFRRMGPPTKMLGKVNLQVLLLIKEINQYLRFGHTPESSIAYAAFAVFISNATLNNLNESYKLGKLAHSLHDKIGFYDKKAEFLFLYALNQFWNQSWENILIYGSEIRTIGFQSGTLTPVALTQILMPYWNTQQNLEKAIQTGKKSLSITQKIGNTQAYNTILIEQQFRLSLQGKTKTPICLTDDSFNETDFIKKHENSQGVAITAYYLSKSILYYTFEDYRNSELYYNTANLSKKAILGCPQNIYFTLYSFLISVMIYPKSSFFKKIILWRRLKKEHKQMKRWATHCSVNFRHQQFLMEAEIARVKNNPKKAAILYEKSIEDAKKNGFLWHEALANERAATLYLSQNDSVHAGKYLSTSYSLYEKWGATAKLEHLQKNYVDLLQTNISYQKETESEADTQSQFDMMTIVKASQAISKEQNLSKFLETMMQLIIHHTGAQKGIFIQAKNNTLYVKAVFDKETQSVNVLNPISIQHFDNIPKSVIEDVNQSNKEIILHHACKDENYMSDPYIKKNQSKSLLCTSIKQDNNLLGILVLENQDAKGVFTKIKLSVLHVLLNQVFISLNNLQITDALNTKVYQLQTISQNIPGMVYQVCLHPDGSFTLPYASDGCKDISGISAEEAMKDPKKLFDLIHSDDYEGVMRYIQYSAKHLLKFDIKFRNVIGEEIIWVHLTSTPEKLLNGTISWYGVQLDITEQKLAEEKQKVIKNQFIEAQRLGKIGNWNWDLINGQDLWSDQFYRVCGFDIETTIPRFETYSKIIHAEDLSKVQNEIEECLKEKRNPCIVYRIIHQKTQDVRWVKVVGEFKFNENEQPINMLGTMQDITEQKVLEFKLKEQKEKEEVINERYRHSQSVASIGSWEWDLNTNEIWWSDELYTLLEVDSEGFDTSYENYISLIHPDDRSLVQHRVEKVIENGKPYEHVIRLNLARNKMKRIKTYGELVVDQNNRPLKLVGTVQDVTNEKVLEFKLQEKKINEDKLLQASDLLQAQRIDAIGHIAGGVAHDFNNTLSIIKPTIQVLKEEPVNKTILKHYESIEQATLHAENIVKQLLIFSRKAPPNKHLLNLNELITSNKEMLEKVINSKIKLSLILCDEDVYLRADSTQIKQSIFNLAINARDAMKDVNNPHLIIRTKTILPTKEVSLTKGYCNERYAVIEVVDNGIGMSPEIIKTIFDPFFTTKPRSEGTGLGLSVIKGIMKSHNGNVKCESLQGKGTTFQLYFPFTEKDIEFHKLKPNKTSSVKNIDRLTKKKWLIIDDNVLVGSTTKLIIESLGVEVILADSGQKGINEYKKQNFDVVIIDYQMPGMNGIETYTKIKKINPKIRAYLYTGDLYSEELKDVIKKEEGQLSILYKPAGKEDFIEICGDPIKRTKPGLQLS